MKTTTQQPTGGSTPCCTSRVQLLVCNCNIKFILKTLTHEKFKLLFTTFFNTFPNCVFITRLTHNPVTNAIQLFRKDYVNKHYLHLLITQSFIYVNDFFKRGNFFIYLFPYIIIYLDLCGAPGCCNAVSGSNSSPIPDGDYSFLYGAHRDEEIYNVQEFFFIKLHCTTN
jgi:hypothetical protein